jgi:hypothetical protein
MEPLVGQRRQGSTTEDDRLSSSPRRFLPYRLSKSILLTISGAMKCSSSASPATVICNHVLLPQLKADRSLFCTYFLTMEAIGRCSFDLLQAYTKSRSSPSGKRFASWTSVTDSRSYCTILNIRFPARQGLIVYNTSHCRGFVEKVPPHCAATGFLYPET